MKPTLLAIDTSTENCSVALQVDNTVISREMESPREHSQRLLPFVQAVLEEADIKLSDVDGLIVGIGPGSFTGVRIGVSIAQGLAFGADLAVQCVSSLDAMALEGAQNKTTDWIISAIDARMGEVYWRAYKNDGERLVTFAPAQVAKPEHLNLSEQLTEYGYRTTESVWSVRAGNAAEQLSNSARNPQSLLAGYLQPPCCVGHNSITRLRWLQMNWSRFTCVMKLRKKLPGPTCNPLNSP